MHVASRRRISLDGEWGLGIDPFDVGVSRRVWECRKESPESGPEDFDVDSFRKVRVPSDWNRAYSDLTHYEGVAWYHRVVERPAGWAGRRAFLYFEAVNYHATVYWNGEELGSHEGGFTPFWFEVTGKLELKNRLVIRVDSTRREDGIPGLRYDWFNYGGVTRSVWLVLSPKSMVRDFSVKTEIKKGKASAVVDFETEGAKKNARARVVLPALGIEVPAKLDAQGRGSARIDLEGVGLWTPHKPRLFRVEVACDGDRVSDEIGFRTIERKGEDILLNGKPVFLRGACLHEEAPRVAGRTLAPRDIDYIFKTARSLGANFLRLAHYPHTELMARAADKSGIMLWEELPVYWQVDFKSKRTRELAKGMLDDLIVRDRNRASVIMWSVANETPQSPERLRFLKDLVKAARRADPTRLVTAAIFAHREKKVFQIKDALAKELDVPGVNQYGGWYSDSAKALKSFKWKSSLKKPVIMSEFGAGAKAGMNGRVDERWTEEYQEEVYRRQLDMIEKIPFVRGTTPWILMDFRSPIRTNRHQQGYNRKGLVSDQGVRKLAFQLVRERYELWRQKGDGK
ncbi:MAG: glycoside hydrolase family 2 protein [Planctomycetota bacterium]